MAPPNRAAWAKKAGEPLSVEPAPYTEPQANEVVIKSSALAINPIDHIMSGMGHLVKQWPACIGCDIAGTIAAVGPGVTQFQEGDRVFATSQAVLRGEPKFGTFQDYSIVCLPTVSNIPSHLADEQVVVLPLGVDTASACLFQKETLGLAMPPTSEGSGKTVIVWGGATSVGLNAIQLATASGYEVITLASEKNSDLCKSLGAATVIDYSSPTVEQDLLVAVQGKSLEGAVCCVQKSDIHKMLCRILAQTGGKPVVAGVMPRGENDGVDGVKVVSVFATTVASNEVGPHIWNNYLPQALASGKYICKPDPVVAGHGLEGIQKAIETWKAGVSAQKIVVKI